MNSAEDPGLYVPFGSWLTTTISVGFSVLFLAGLSFALEETERSIYLQPRHFNPHPYEVSGYETNGNRGPVLFPTTPPDPDDPSGNSNNLPIDDSPYTAVVRKHQREQAERFLDENKKAYAFSYKVQDRFSGDDFSHSQKQDSKSTNGEYRVKLPDGRIQIVSYIADKNGYKADVKYAENENSNPTAYSSEQQIRPIQIVPNEIKRKPDQYDYLYEDDYGADISLQPKFAIYKDTTHVPIYHLTAAASPVVVSPTPTVPVTRKYENQLQINPYLILNTNNAPSISGGKLFENIHDPSKVIQIDENNFNNGKVGKFIDSTLAPYTIEHSKGFQKTILSTLSPQQDYGADHHFGYPRKQQHQYFYKK
ncbi:hypothetical protein PPYR_14739 [Photinus pyralis]|uniref:Uncharacterized protein n=1 Tax=Photinus pyralis TaxID=7054 RepID=A0A5N4A629_PHOPY|nr:hypothetical protein PPYR_14739 [Photinus pyralis]